MLIGEAVRERWCKILDVLHLCVIFHTNTREEQETYLQALIFEALGACMEPNSI